MTQYSSQVWVMVNIMITIKIKITVRVRVGVLGLLLVHHSRLWYTMSGLPEHNRL